MFWTGFGIGVLVGLLLGIWGTIIVIFCLVEPVAKRETLDEWRERVLKTPLP